jgi:phage tail sheath protein FI
MFDSSIRMMHYIKNSFQKNYVSAVDGPFSRRKIESILGEAQVWINGLVSIGAILYGKITFENQNNPSGQLAKGNFVFDVATTTTPPGKSITFRLQYSSVGLDTLVQA